MSPTDIRILLLQRSISQAEIGRRLGITRSAVHALIEGRLTSPERRAQVAELLGMSAGDIWDTSTSGGGGSRSAPSQSEADSVNMSTSAPAQVTP